MSDRLPAPPDDLRPRGRGRGFWRAVVADHDLRPDELELLAEACRMLDLADALRDCVDVLVVDGRMHPALVELRQVRESLRKTLAALALPDATADGELPSHVADMRTVKARRAAQARWSRGA